MLEDRAKTWFWAPFQAQRFERAHWCSVPEVGCRSAVLASICSAALVRMMG
jgi:hypothetical protein